MWEEKNEIKLQRLLNSFQPTTESGLENKQKWRRLGTINVTLPIPPIFPQEKTETIPSRHCYQAMATRCHSCTTASSDCGNPMLWLLLFPIPRKDSLWALALCLSGPWFRIEAWCFWLVNQYSLHAHATNYNRKYTAGVFSFHRGTLYLLPIQISR